MLIKLLNQARLYILSFVIPMLKMWQMYHKRL